MSKEFEKWWKNKAYRRKYPADHPAYLAAKEAWEAASSQCIEKDVEIATRLYIDDLETQIYELKKELRETRSSNLKVLMKYKNALETLAAGCEPWNDDFRENPLRVIKQYARTVLDE